MTILPHRSIEAMYVSRRSANPGGEAGHCGLVEKVEEQGNA
jgi:hypothetical protein